ncbi:hypothetical protein BJY01DRAFT_249238 [Aspergillus pseudoustus]|uniref:BHLH domain-containing protein n=1 Tax=Aspergillus pseudoustus TaxID=1810923 RepID=A0ABR4JQ82_9EURO
MAMALHSSLTLSLVLTNKINNGHTRHSSATSTSTATPATTALRAGSPRKRSLPYPSSAITRKLIEIRPKGGPRQTLSKRRSQHMGCSLANQTAPTTTLEVRRQQHADAQKYQRDRMKAALDRMARLMEMGGVAGEGTGGTKAQLLEAAVEYMQHLQGQVEELRAGGSRGLMEAMGSDPSSGHATRNVGPGGETAQECDARVD